MATKRGASKKASKKATGSEKMRAARGGSKKSSAPSGPLENAIRALDRKKIRHDILIKGTPRPDLIKGTLTARNPAELNSALGTLMGVRGIEYKPIRLFPKGVPVIREIVAQLEGKLKR